MGIFAKTTGHPNGNGVFFKNNFYLHTSILYTTINYSKQKKNPSKLDQYFKIESPIEAINEDFEGGIEEKERFRKCVEKEMKFLFLLFCAWL